MMNFYDKEEYTFEDIEDLIINEVEENIHLDYKSTGSISKDDKKKTEITKDVSAFANSDGGIIIYGLSEADHKPYAISPIDGSQFTKEWLEQVILRIQRHIQGIRIYPVRKNGNILETIYIVKIPKSNQAPHMADNQRYYKRHNFMSVPMEEYEVRDCFNRLTTPTLQLVSSVFVKDDENSDEDNTSYRFWCKVENVSNTVAENFKISVIVHEHIGNMVISNDLVFKDKLFLTTIDLSSIKISSQSEESLYPNEKLDAAHIRIVVPTSYSNLFKERVCFDINVLYKGGSERTLYIPSKGKFIDKADDIEDYLKSC